VLENGGNSGLFWARLLRDPLATLLRFGGYLTRISFTVMYKRVCVCVCVCVCLSHPTCFSEAQIYSKLCLKWSSCLTETQPVSVTGVNSLKLFGAIISLCSENHMKPITTLCEQNVKFLNVKLGGTYSSHCAAKIWMSRNVHIASPSVRNYEAHTYRQTHTHTHTHTHTEDTVGLVSQNKDVTLFMA
jgi:hypothetical protein